MTRFRYFVASSLDGFIADRHGSLDWLTSRDSPVDGSGENAANFSEFIGEIGAVVMGRSTYEFVLGLGDADWGYTVPAWVLTHRALPAAAGHDVRFFAGDVRDLRDDLIAAAGHRDVWIVGGGDVAAQFAQRGMLDELLVTVIPIVLGAGAPLLATRDDIDLMLTGCRTQSDGSVFVRYAVESGT